MLIREGRPGRIRTCAPPPEPGRIINCGVSGITPGPSAESSVSVSTATETDHRAATES